ncbi:hypothetical protein AB6F13_01640 [Staphylococcus saprophyticus]|uniref:hypothetical protein n=1 Tax=Staphylococcus saprophyticus TaxID=29385 RepID=UPI00297B1552|nr:hypothetical protein [Staphylococcus saprophyticus]
MINFDEIAQDINALFEKENGATISKNTGVPYQTVQDLRNGKAKLENARLHTVRKLYEYANTHLNE